MRKKMCFVEQSPRVLPPSAASGCHLPPGGRLSMLSLHFEESNHSQHRPKGSLPRNPQLFPQVSCPFTIMLSFSYFLLTKTHFPPNRPWRGPGSFAGLVVKVFLDTTPCGGKLSTGRHFHHLPHPLNFLSFRDMMSQQKTSAEVFHKQLSTAHDAPQSWAFFPGALRGAAGYTQAEGRYAWT